MTAYYSTQVTNADASPPTFLETNEIAGRVRIAYFDYTVPTGNIAAADTIDLVYLPAGRVRILKTLSVYLCPIAFDATCVLDIGVVAHTDQDGSTAVAATTDDLSDGGATTAAVEVIFGTGTNAALTVTRLLNANDRVAVQALLVTAGATALDTIQGFVCYVND